MPVFTAAAASIVTAAGFTAGTTSFLIAQSVVAAGLAYGAGKLTGAFDTPDIDLGSFGDFEDRGVEQRLGANTQNKIPLLYGNWMTRGALSYFEVTDDRQTLHAVITLGEGPSTSIDTIYWDDLVLTLDGNGVVSSATDLDGNSVDRLNGKVTIHTYPTGGRSTYLEGVSSDWTSSHKMTNLVYAVVSVEYDREKEITGLADIRFVGTSPISDPSDAVKDLLENTRYGMGMAASLIDTASFAAAKTYYSTAVGYTDHEGNAQTQSRFAVNGVMSTEESVQQRIESILKGSDSFLKWSNGKFGIFVNKADAAVDFTFTEDNILGNISVSETGMNNLVNRVEINYGRNANANWQRGTTYVSAPNSVKYPNEPDRTVSLDLSLTATNTEAERIATVLLNQARQQLTVRHKADVTAMPLEAGDVVKYTDADYGWTNKLFRIIAITEEEENGVIQYDVQAVEYAAAVYTESTLVETDVAPNVAVYNSADIEAVSDLNIGSISSHSATPYFTLEWTVPNNSLIEYFDVYANAVNDSFSSPLTFLVQTTRLTEGSNYTAGSSVSAVISTLTAGTYSLWVVAKNSFAASSESNRAILQDWNPEVIAGAERDLVFRFHENLVTSDPGAPFGSNGTGGGWLVASNDPHWQAVTQASYSGAERRVKTYSFAGTAGATVGTTTDTFREVDVEISGTVGNRSTLLSAQPEITSFEFNGNAANIGASSPTYWQIAVGADKQSDPTVTQTEARYEYVVSGTSDATDTWANNILPLTPWLTGDPDDDTNGAFIGYDSSVVNASKWLSSTNAWQSTTSSGFPFVDNGTVDDIRLRLIARAFSVGGAGITNRPEYLVITNKDKSSYGMWRAAGVTDYSYSGSASGLITATGATGWTLTESAGTFDESDKYCVFLTSSNTMTGLTVGGDILTVSTFFNVVNTVFPTSVNIPLTAGTNTAAEIVTIVNTLKANTNVETGTYYDANVWSSGVRVNPNIPSGTTTLQLVPDDSHHGNSPTGTFPSFVSHYGFISSSGDNANPTLDASNFAFTEDRVATISTQITISWDNELDPVSTVVDLGGAATSAQIASVISSIVDDHPELTAYHGTATVSGGAVTIVDDNTSRNVIVETPNGSYGAPTIAITRNGTVDADDRFTSTITSLLTGAEGVAGAVPTRYNIVVAGTIVASGGFGSNATGSSMAEAVNAVAVPGFTSTRTTNTVVFTTSTNTGALPISINIIDGTNGTGLTGDNDAYVTRTLTQQGSSVETFAGQSSEIDIRLGGTVVATRTFNNSTIATIRDDLISQIDTDGTYDASSLTGNSFRATALALGAAVPALNFVVRPGTNSSGVPATLAVSVITRSEGQIVNITAGRLTEVIVTQGVSEIVDVDITANATPTQAASQVATAINAAGESRYTASTVDNVLTITSNFFGSIPDMNLTVNRGLTTGGTEANMDVTPTLVSAGAQGVLDLTDAVWQYFVINQEPRIDDDLLQINSADNTISVRRGLVLDTTIIEASATTGWAQASTTHTTGSRTATLVIIGAANAISRTTTTTGAYVAIEMEYSTDGGSTWADLSESVNFPLTYADPFDNDVVTPALNITATIDVAASTTFTFRGRRKHSNSGASSIGWSMLVLEELRGT